MGAFNALGRPTAGPLLTLIDNSSIRTDEAILGTNWYLSILLTFSDPLTENFYKIFLVQP